MPGLRALVAVLFCCGAARAEQLLPLIQRPLTLPAGTVDFTLQGTYTNWVTGAAADAALASGESLVLAVDFGAPNDPWGVVDAAQLGFALWAAPTSPRERRTSW
jgi:hypothetical protein